MLIFSIEKSLEGKYNFGRVVNKFERWQSELVFQEVYPKKDDGTCSCGCGEELIGRQVKWSSEECCTMAYRQFAILKGNAQIIREELFKRDEGFCQNCGVYDENWQADHITPVFKGGGGCGLDNFQTLCEECHKEKTYMDCHHKEISSQDASNLYCFCLYAPGATS